MNADEAIAENGRIVRGEPTWGYHGSNKYVLDALLHGGLPNDGGSNRNLANHVRGGVDSAFRGLSPIASFGDPSQIFTAAEFAEEGGLVIEVIGVVGWSTPLWCPEAIKSLSRAEAELAILRPVPPVNIGGIGQVEERHRFGNAYLAVKWLRAKR